MELPPSFFFFLFSFYFFFGGGGALGCVEEAHRPGSLKATVNIVVRMPLIVDTRIEFQGEGERELAREIESHKSVVYVL